MTLERRIRGLVADGSGLDKNLVIPGNSKGDRPLDPYASLLYGERVREAFPVFEDNAQGQTETSNWRAVTFSLQFYRQGAVDRAHQFEEWIETPVGLDAATEADLQFEFPIVVRRLDLEIGDAFEERAQIDLTVRHRTVTAQETGTVDRVSGMLSVSDREDRRGPTVVISGEVQSG